jgi:hypothetical protein
MLVPDEVHRSINNLRNDPNYEEIVSFIKKKAEESVGMLLASSTAHTEMFKGRCQVYKELLSFL